MKRFKVHIFAEVRVPVEVEADTAIEAARKADAITNLYEIVKTGRCEYAENVTNFVVDEFNSDGEMVNSVLLSMEECYENVNVAEEGSL